jgi:hypothetical protein
MHSSKGRAVPLQNTRTGIRVDAEIVGSFIGIVCALHRTEWSVYTNVAVFILDVAVVGNAPDNECQCPYSKNAQHDDDGYDDQDDLERIVSLR